MKINMTIDLSTEDAENLLNSIEYKAAQQVANNIYKQADISKCVNETVKMITKARKEKIMWIVEGADGTFKDEFIKQMAETSAGRIGWMLMKEPEFMEKLSNMIVEKLQTLEDKV
jgi:hypothetical protein